MQTRVLSYRVKAAEQSSERTLPLRETSPFLQFNHAPTSFLCIL